MHHDELDYDSDEPRSDMKTGAEDESDDTDKRAYHNLLERKRRDHIKDSFTSLKDVLPGFKGGKVRASRAQILRKAVDFINQTKFKNDAHLADIEDLKKENFLLEDQIRTLQNALETGDLEAASTYIKDHGLPNQRLRSATRDLSSDSEEEETGAVDVDDSTDSEDSYVVPQCKRRKFNPKSGKRS